MLVKVACTLEKINMLGLLNNFNSHVYGKYYMFYEGENATLKWQKSTKVVGEAWRQIKRKQVYCWLKKTIASGTFSRPR